MNKKTLIAIIVIALIIGLAIFTGTKLGKNNSNPTSGEPGNNITINSNPTKEPSDTEDASPEPTEEPTASPEPTPNVDISKMNATEKEEYAKNIAKETWEKLGVDKKVYYSYDKIEDEANYIITVRESSTTKELVRYKIDIKTRTCEIIF